MKKTRSSNSVYVTGLFLCIVAQVICYVDGARRDKRQAGVTTSTLSSVNTTAASSNTTDLTSHNATVPDNTSISAGNNTALTGNSTAAPGNATMTPTNATFVTGNVTAVSSTNSSLIAPNATSATGNATSLNGNSTTPLNTTASGGNASLNSNSLAGNSTASATNGSDINKLQGLPGNAIATENGTAPNNSSVLEYTTMPPEITNGSTTPLSKTTGNVTIHAGNSSELGVTQSPLSNATVAGNSTDLSGTTTVSSLDNSTSTGATALNTTYNITGTTPVPLKATSLANITAVTPSNASVTGGITSAGSATTQPSSTTATTQAAPTLTTSSASVREAKKADLAAQASNILPSILSPAQYANSDYDTKAAPPPQNPSLLMALKALRGSAAGAAKSIDMAEMMANAVAGKDYPNLSQIPDTKNFACKDVQQAGFYADTDTDCQVIRRCDINGNLWSYLCPNMTRFNQIELVCDWFWNVDCSQSKQFYDYSNSRLYHASWVFLDTPPNPDTDDARKSTATGSKKPSDTKSSA
ncbi:autotransporter adhesin BpaC-like [Paramacrobiotus metropolitanus]|uniref:autotransporter adhesin BpaC-like n=1 Tax=Paramacrobiotus metropolitanus TaxID=2943436 RepID=UPI002445EB9B|nr:autotransporter adhesin BpaC-like [Paramacrobiotus metropolitanus]